MKQLLFLLLFPCLALAQYTGNAGQKITLGEQTTADGLIWRGVAADTTLTVKSDTAAYFVLDTVNLNLFTYKTSASGAKWRQLGADTAAIAYVNTYGTQTVNGAKTFTSEVTATRFNPTSSTATGTGMFAPTSTSLGFSTSGTNRMTLDNRGNIGIGITPNADINSEFQGFQFLQGGSFFTRKDIPILFFSSNIITNEIASLRQVDGRGVRFVANSFNSIGYDFWVETVPYGVAGTSGSPVRKISLEENGNFGIGDNITMTQKLDVDGNARIRAVGTASDGNAPLYVTSTGVLSTNISDVNKKHNIRNLPYGLSTINNLNPVAFEWNETDESDIGFIAQDIENVIPESVITNWDSELIFRQEKIIPVLVKAIQEQQALIKSLEQRILILENK